MLGPEGVEAHVAEAAAGGLGRRAGEGPPVAGLAMATPVRQEAATAAPAPARLEKWPAATTVAVMADWANLHHPLPMVAALEAAAGAAAGFHRGGFSV